MKETADIKPVNSEKLISSAIQSNYEYQIPYSWEVKHFEEIADIDKNSLKGETSKDYVFEYISLSDVDKDELIIETSKQVFSSAPSRARRIVIKGDILMSTVRPNLQGFSIIKDEVKDLIASTGFAVITPTKCVNEFLYHYLFSYGISKQFYQLLVGSNYPAINSSDVKRLKVLLPPLPEQRAIATLLSTWDEAIQTVSQLIAQKELSKKWLMQNLLTGKKRLNLDFPDSGIKGLGEVEKSSQSFNPTNQGADNGKRVKGGDDEWKRIGAGEIFKSITVKGFASEELLSVTQDRGVVPRSMTVARVTMPSGETTGFKLVEAGDFVISLRSFQGGLEYSYYRGIVSPAYTVLKPRKKINDEFYKQYFKSYDFIGHLAVAVIGIRDGKQISYEDFCFVKIPYPSLEEQTAIAEILQTADNELQLLKDKLELLKEQKKGLMQVLLTGKKRLNLDFPDSGIKGLDMTEKSSNPLIQ